MANQINVNNNGDNFEQELEAYEQHMQEELTAAQALIQAMENAQGQEGQYESQLNSLEKSVSLWRMEQGILGPGQWMTNTSWAKIYDTDAYNAIEGDKAAINTLNNIVQEKEQALEAIDPNVNGTVINQLNQLLAQTNALVNDNLRGDDLNRAIQQATVIFTQLCQALMSSIQVDLAQAGMKQFGSSSDPRAAAAILQFAGVAIQGEFQEQFALQNIQTNVINDSEGWQSEKSQAQADLDTAHWYDFFTGGGPDSGKDHAEIRAANAMISLLNQIEATISPLMTIVDPGMQEFTIELDQLKKKLQSLIANGGSLQAIKDAMVEALSILTGIIAETEKDSSMYDKEMNQGSMASSQMHLSDALAQQEVINDAEKYASIMGGLLKAAQFLGAGLAFALNPGAGMAIMVAIQMALMASGLLDKLQSYLASQMGDIGASALMCGIEIGATAGGAGGIDALIGSAVQTATKAAAEVTEEVVEEAVEAALQSTQKIADKVGESAAAAARAGGATEAEALQIGQQASQNAMAAARSVAKDTVEEAVTTAQKKVGFVYMNKSIPQLISSMSRDDLTVTLQEAVAQAAQNAAKSPDLEMLIDTAAKQGSSEVVGEAEITSIARQAADKAVAKAANVSEESIANIDKMTLMGDRTAGKKIVSRSIFTGFAAMGSTGFMTDTVAAWKKENKKDLSEGWQISMEVIQSLMQFIGMLGQTDIPVQSIMANPGNTFNKVLLGGSLVQNSLETIGSAGVAETDFEQAGAIKAIAKDQSVLDMMQFVMQQLQQDAQLQRDRYSQEMQQTSKTTTKLAMHFNDAEQEVAQALAVLPV